MKASKLTTLLLILLLFALLHETGVRAVNRLTQSMEQVQPSDVAESIATIWIE